MKAVDPICGMTVDTESAAATAEYEGKTYYFCAPGCRQEFLKDPAKYANGQHGGHDMGGGHGHHGH